jgi:DNA-binding XRE family transcriptional regulator
LKGGKDMENRLRECREEKGMTQVELSEKSGVTRTIISYIETNKDMDVKLSTLSAISKALGKKVSDIFLV